MMRARPAFAMALPTLSVMLARSRVAMAFARSVRDASPTPFRKCPAGVPCVWGGSEEAMTWRG